MLLSAAVLLLAGGAARAERVTGNGHVIDQTRTVGEFSAIEVSSGIEVRVEAGPRSVLGVRGEDNILPHVQTEIQGKTLHIGFERNVSINSHSTIQVVLSIPTLDSLAASGGSRLEVSTPSGDALSIAASGGARVRVTTSVRPRQLSIEASGGSEVSVDGVATGPLAISSSGAAVVTLAGKAQTLNLELSGGSELHGAKLSVGALEVEGGGGGVATVRVMGPAHGSISGGTQLNVGPEATVDVETSGGAAVRRKL